MSTLAANAKLHRDGEESAARHGATALRDGFVVAIVAIVPFAASLSFGFVWDDGGQLLANPYVTGPTPIVDVFTHDLWGFHTDTRISHAFYRPVPIALWKLLYSVCGANPAPFHAANVVLHAAVAVLLLLVLRRFSTAGLALFAATLFAVHPLRVESVVWVVSGMDLLCSALLLVALLAFLAGLAARSSVLVVAALASFAVAALSKESAFTFPAFLVVFVASYRRGDRRAWLSVAAFWLVAGVVMLVRQRFVSGNPASFFTTQLFTTPLLLARYVAAMTVPFPHVLHSTFRPVTSVGDPRLVLAVGALAAAAYALARAFTKAPLVIVAAAWAVLTALPACLAPSMNTIYAERYTYMPAMAVSALLAAGLVFVMRRLAVPPRVGRAAAVAIVCVLALVSASRSLAWRSDETLFAAMAEQDPDDAMALFNIALAKVQAGRLDEARSLLERVVQVNPADADAWFILGDLALKDRDPGRAVDLYRRALAAWPGHLEARYNLAQALAAKERCDEARREAYDLRSVNDAAHAAIWAKAQAAGDPLGQMLSRYCP